MRIPSLALALALTALPATAAEQELVLDPARTAIAFDLPATGHDVHGVLELTAGRIGFDPETGEASGVVAVDAVGARTGNGSRDKTLREKVFEAARFPRIEFAAERMSGAVAPEGVSEITLHGTMTLHGEPHPMALPARLEVHGAHLTAETEFEVPFLDWGLHDPSVLFLRVGRVVTVKVRADGELRVPAPTADAGSAR